MMTARYRWTSPPTCKFGRLTIVIILLVELAATCDGDVAAVGDKSTDKRSLADRLLALWTNSDGSPTTSRQQQFSREQMAMSPSNVFHGGGASIDRPDRHFFSNGIADENSPRTTSPSDGLAIGDQSPSLKKVLEFLSSKAVASTGNKKLPDAALKGLEALASGAAKTPRPIESMAVETSDSRTPLDAVLAYFHGMGIDDYECRKRTICELLTEPQAGYGVFGELLGYVFGGEQLNPAWTRTPDEADIYRGYHEAATAGRRMLECDQLYGVCPNSYKEYIKLANVR